MAMIVSRWLFPVSDVSYGFLTASASIVESISENIPLLPATEGVLEVLISSFTLASPQSVRLELVGVADTPDDPSNEFVGPALSVGMITSSSAAASVLTSSLSAPIPALGRLELTATQGGTGGLALRARFGVRLTLRGLASSAAVDLTRISPGWTVGGAAL